MLALIADEGNGLEMWRAADSRLNKQSRTADKEWSTILGLDVGSKIPHHKEQF
jgi:hypothetical protein